MMNIKLNKYLTRACIRNLNLWVQICYSNDLKMGAGGGHRGKYGCPSGNYKELTQIWMGTNLYTYQNQEIHQKWKSQLYHGVVSRIV